MTLGKASSPSLSTGTHHPSGNALSTPSSDQTSSSSSKWVKTWRTVAAMSPLPGDGRMGNSRRAIGADRPVGGRNAGHRCPTGPRPGAFAGKPRRLRCAAHRPRPCAAASSPSSACADSAPRTPAFADRQDGAQRAQRAGRIARRADRRAQIHHRLREVAGAPGRQDRRLPRCAPSPCPAASVSSMRQQPRHHALDIAVHHGNRFVEGDSRDRRAGIGADPGQRLQVSGGLREIAGMARTRLPRRISSNCAPANNSQGPAHARMTSSAGARAMALIVGHLRDEIEEIGVDRASPAFAAA